MILKQISLFLENHAGTLAQITRLLSENDINLRALNIAETADYGVLRIIADQPDKASKLLLDNGFIISTSPVVGVPVDDRPGGLNEILNLLADNGIDISYMYSIFGGEDGKAFMIMRVDDADNMVRVLDENGIGSVTGKDIGNH